MSGEYRDELAAAHARIEELEEKVRALREEAHPETRPLDGRFPELEAEVLRLRKETDATVAARRQTGISTIGAILPLGGLVFTFARLPLVAAVFSGLFVLTVVANLVLGRRLKSMVAKRDEAEAKLGDARRIAELESKLAETRVRVESLEDDSVVDEVEGGAEAGVRRRA